MAPGGRSGKGLCGAGVACLDMAIDSARERGRCDLVIVMVWAKGASSMLCVEFLLDFNDTFEG